MRTSIVQVLILAAASGVVAPSTLAQQTLGVGGLTGRVEDARGKPIQFAQVALVNGTAAATSDSIGRFRITGINIGSNIFEVRRIGYNPVYFEVGVPDSVMVDVKVRMTESPRELTPVKVEDVQDPLRRVGFYDRMRAGYGHFVSPEMLANMHPVRATDAFAAIPNLVVDRRGNKSRVMTANYRCEYGIIVDNVLVGEPGSRTRTTSPDDLVSASDLYAIEVYPRNRGLPPKFLGLSHEDGCGTIVIWTKGMKGSLR